MRSEGRIPFSPPGEGARRADEGRRIHHGFRFSRDRSRSPTTLIRPCRPPSPGGRRNARISLCKTAQHQNAPARVRLGKSPGLIAASPRMSFPRSRVGLVGESPGDAESPMHARRASEGSPGEVPGAHCSPRMSFPRSRVGLVGESPGDAESPMHARRASEGSPGEVPGAHCSPRMLIPRSRVLMLRRLR